MESDSMDLVLIKFNDFDGFSSTFTLPLTLFDISRLYHYFLAGG